MVGNKFYNSIKICRKRKRKKLRQKPNNEW